MARTRTYEERRIATAVRLPESVHRRLNEAASNRDISANLLVTRAVVEFLDRLPTADAPLAEPVGRTRPPRGADR
jgi:predicted transcriptional regulator